ncbi:fatty acid desaturase family protein [Pseudomonas subflava]|uniref:fatty acid desaturase family protein n=1 Tax=Pseudomonas subflava TaxID=2952933 RepID=UPI0020792C7D|nr:fatty acid desaturase [Pseudomonas subflava]
MAAIFTQHPELRGQLLALREKYAQPRPWRSTWQVLVTLVPHFALNGLIYWSWGGPLWITLALLVVNSLFLNRLVVVFHDLLHGSMYRSRGLGNLLGRLISPLIFMPAAHWQYEHNFHHASANDLSRRGYGDMPLLTVREYQALGPWARFRYRVLRHPLFLFGPHALYKLMIFPRTVANPAWPRRVKRSVHLTNLTLVVIGLALWAFGLERLIWIQLLSYAISTPTTVLLFYINHHFEEAHWSPAEQWDFFGAALKGTSVLVYPPVMRWFACGIGLHCMHHLVPRIPNYNLEACWKENALFADAAVIPLFWKGLATTRLRLWDEQAGRYVGSEGYRLAQRQAATT